jgi:hypothetical protein
MLKSLVKVQAPADTVEPEPPPERAVSCWVKSAIWACNAAIVEASAVCAEATAGTSAAPPPNVKTVAALKTIEANFLPVLNVLIVKLILLNKMYRCNLMSTQTLEYTDQKTSNN